LPPSDLNSASISSQDDPIANLINAVAGD